MGQGKALTNVVPCVDRKNGKKIRADRSEEIDVNLMDSDTLVLNFYREAYAK